MIRATPTLAVILLMAAARGPALAAAQSKERAHDLIVKPMLTSNYGKTAVPAGANVPIDQVVKLTCQYAFVILEDEKTPALLHGGGSLMYASNTGKWVYYVLPWRGAMLLDGESFELFDGEKVFEAKPYPTAYGTPKAATGSASKEVVLAKAGTRTFRCLVDADKKFVEVNKANNSAEISVKVLGPVTAGAAKAVPPTVQVRPPVRRRRP